MASFAAAEPAACGTDATPAARAAAAPRAPARLRVTVASATRSVELWVRPTASCDLLRARVAETFDLPPAAFRLVLGQLGGRELRGAWCLGTAGLRRSSRTVLVVGTGTAPRPAGAAAPAAPAAPDRTTPACLVSRAVAASLPPRRRRPARAGPDRPWAAHPWAAGGVAGLSSVDHDPLDPRSQPG
jgi:hypothetical protein